MKITYINEDEPEYIEEDDDNQENLTAFNKLIREVNDNEISRDPITVFGDQILSVIIFNFVEIYGFLIFIL